MASNDGTPLAPVRKAVLLVVHVYSEANKNGEQSIRIVSAREAGQRERRVYIRQTPERMAKRQRAGDESEIDYSDAPPLTDEQLRQYRRAPKVLVAARVDRDVYDWLRQYGEGYSTPIWLN